MENKNADQNKSLADKNHSLNVLNKEVGLLRALIYVILVILVVETTVFIHFSSYSFDLDEVFWPHIVISRQQASLFLSPNVGNYLVDDEFDIDVLVNTKNNDIVVTAAYLSYDKEKLQALNIDLAGSEFQFVAEKEINQKEGKIKITQGKPTPGINSNNGKIATVRFKALQPTIPQDYNIYFNFTKGSPLYSCVILDDKKGTNILSSVHGANIFIKE